MTPTITPEPGPVIPLIDGTGIILKWDTDAMQCVIRTERDKEKTFTIDPQITIPFGYSPAPGDTVAIKYEMMTMNLKEIRFLTREDTMSTGTIVAWEDDICTLKDVKYAPEADDNPALKDSGSDGRKADDKRNTIVLAISDEIDIPVGYMPQKGDVVLFEYEEYHPEEDPDQEKAPEDVAFMLTYIRYLSCPEGDAQS